ncbi:hypothetical protein D3C85_1761260 [compost metagenome]
MVIDGFQLSDGFSQQLLTFISEPTDDDDLTAKQITTQRLHVRQLLLDQVLFAGIVECLGRPLKGLQRFSGVISR